MNNDILWHDIQCVLKTSISLELIYGPSVCELSYHLFKLFLYYVEFYIKYDIDKVWHILVMDTD